METVIEFVLHIALVTEMGQIELNFRLPPTKNQYLFIFLNTMVIYLV